MNDRPNPARVQELRYALEVMEENSHLGLDDEGASNIKRILLRRIAEAGSELARRPIPPLSVDANRESKVSA
jgi:hypothetical protein